MTDWTIRVPHRDSAEPLSVTAANARVLEGDERAIAREIALHARLELGLHTAGELLDHVGALEPHERRQLLDKARAAAGLEPIADVEGRERVEVATAAARRSMSGGGGFPTCADPECNAAPVRHGIFYNPAVRRWWCPNHIDQAEPGDLEPRGSGLRLSPAGVPVDDDPAADAADREREASRRAQLEHELEIRAVEAAEAAASKRVRDEASRRELPEHLRRMAPA
jgi:hypothetical protein